MDNKLLGLVLIIFGLAIFLVDLSFTMEFMARGQELHKSCPLPPEICPFIEPPWQGIIIGAIAAALIIMGVYIYRKQPLPEAPRQKLDPKRAEETLKMLEGDEQTVYKLIADDNGMIFQSKLIEKTGFTKVKISRILDTMESKGLVERKRRGMTNVVVAK